MKGLENQMYLLLLAISNVVAILLIGVSIKWRPLVRICFFILFAWACWINWKASLQTPQEYLEYGNLTLSGWYRDFINGWFVGHVGAVIGFIATGQSLVAVSMLLKGHIFRIGAIVFLIAILPLGVGSGFPATAFMAVTIYFF